MWSSIEKEILSHLPEYRLDNLRYFAAPLYTMKDVYAESHGKYTSVGIRKPGTLDERLEIRIYQGTMNIDEILAWLDFCIFFLSITIFYDESVDIKSLENLFPKHSRKFLKYN